LGKNAQNPRASPMPVNSFLIAIRAQVVSQRPVKRERSVTNPDLPPIRNLARYGVHPYPSVTNPDLPPIRNYADAVKIDRDSVTNPDLPPIRNQQFDWCHARGSVTNPDLPPIRNFKREDLSGTWSVTNPDLPQNPDQTVVARMVGRGFDRPTIRATTRGQKSPLEFPGRDAKTVCEQIDSKRKLSALSSLSAFQIAIAEFTSVEAGKHGAVNATRPCGSH
jgi:hypothetical protein